METIFKIIGGGQKVRQNAQLGLSVEYVKVANSDWPEKAQCAGQDHFTGSMWFTDFDTLQRRANEWAGQDVELVQVEEEVY